MKWYVEVEGEQISIEPPELVWSATIRAGSESAARKIADEIDRAAGKRDLQSEERKLREIIRDEKGF